MRHPAWDFPPRGAHEQTGRGFSRGPLVSGTDAPSPAVEPEHLLSALLESNENNLSAIIERIGAEPSAIKASIDEKIEQGPKTSGGIMQMGFGNRLAKVLDEAVKKAGEMGDAYATTEHLLIALLFQLVNRLGLLP